MIKSINQSKSFTFQSFGIFWRSSFHIHFLWSNIIKFSWRLVLSFWTSIYLKKIIIRLVWLNCQSLPRYTHQSGLLSIFTHLVQSSYLFKYFSVYMLSQKTWVNTFYTVFSRSMQCKLIGGSCKFMLLFLSLMTNYVLCIIQT